MRVIKGTNSRPISAAIYVALVIAEFALLVYLWPTGFHIAAALVSLVIILTALCVFTNFLIARTFGWEEEPIEFEEHDDPRFIG